MVLKLYYSPGGCSLAPHIVLRELGKQFEIQKVRLHSTEEDAREYEKINPKGVVPVLQLENGEVLTENIAINLYIGHKSKSELFPENGTLKYFRFLEWFLFFNTDLHHTYGKLFSPHTEEDKPKIFAKLDRFYAIIDKGLTGKEYLTGDTITAADIYLFVLSTWPQVFFPDYNISKFTNFVKLFNKVLVRPKVQEAIKAEGITINPL